MSVRVAFLWRDLWLGVYIGQPQYGIGPRGVFRSLSLYICVVPMFPVIVTRTVYEP